MSSSADTSSFTTLVGGFGLVAITLLVIAQIVLFVVALLSIVRSENYASGGKALWALACFAFPLLGPILWFVAGKNSKM
ncbi:PLDc_N domain-containing protein [Corynebacterium hindlerae]|uniref:PLDc_N domain-containing protein n=1 Tax=Corynebacterium hindlerae TaxID=699041 RepID=A0A7G5FI80_9CORY|nr:PLD nuclease N-terminal domain-containing protein [Corynebacterium hindlerae]QMV86321.1 PLDc_N domain-containing protein [Corynebacterium hindlerae]